MMVAATIVTMKATMSALQQQQQQRQVSLVSTVCVSDVVDLMVSKRYVGIKCTKLWSVCPRGRRAIAALLSELSFRIDCIDFTFPQMNAHLSKNIEKIPQANNGPDH